MRPGPTPLAIVRSPVTGGLAVLAIGGRCSL